MFKRLVIKKLFNRFDYDIKLNFQDTDNLILLTAPNGFGKSTILKIIDYFFNKNFIDLEKINFEEIIFYINNDSVSITKFTDGRFRTLKFIHSDKSTYTYNLRLRTRRNQIDIIENRFPFLEKIGPDEWLDSRYERLISNKDIEYEFGINLREHRLIGSESTDLERKWLNSITSTSNVEFISTERLFDKDNKLAVTRMSEKISQIIRVNNREQFIVSKKQENSFPKRVMDKLERNRPLAVGEIVEKINKLKFFNENYNKNEIFGPTNLEQDIIDKLYSEEISQNKSFLLVLNEYISDALNKTKKVEPLAKKLELFTRSINTLFIFKSIHITSDEGIIVKNYEGEPINLDSLSSGEQHLLIMIATLIFESEKIDLVLLDEPEISLHPAWQEQFINIIDSIKKLNNIKIIISTHSPSLIGENWNGVIELAELFEREETIND